MILLYDLDPEPVPAVVLDARGGVDEFDRACRQEADDLLRWAAKESTPVTDYLPVPLPRAERWFIERSRQFGVWLAICLIVFLCQIGVAWFFEGLDRFGVGP